MRLPARGLHLANTHSRWFTTQRSIDPRPMSAEDAVKYIGNGSVIYVHSIAAFPRIIANALADRAKHQDIRDLVVTHLHLEGKDPFDVPELHDKIKSYHLFVGKNSRRSVSEGHGTYLPVFLSDIPALMRRRRIPLDWALLNVSPPDRHGFCSLGPEVCTALPAAQSATKVIAQINPNIPRVHGHSFLHYSSFDYVVDVTGSPDAVIPAVDPSPISDKEMRIGKILADLIPDGATLQVGIGAIPNAVLKSLTNHRDLGIHSEMISDGAMELIKSGAVNNMRKDFIPGRTVSSFLVGSKALYDFVDDNPGIHLDEASITNRPAIIARNKKVVAINSAVQVDLTGQVCADSVGTRLISGIGGQLDFEQGAAMSEGGIPIICLPSLSKSGESTIVNTLTAGAGVTTTRYHAHWIVTEYGATNLWGLDMQKRARELINLAHPSKREQLAKEAHERYGIII